MDNWKRLRKSINALDLEVANFRLLLDESIYIQIKDEIKEVRNWIDKVEKQLYA